MSRSQLPEIWGTLSKKVLASVLVDDGAVFVVQEIIGSRADWFAPKDRPVWRSILQCVEEKVPPTIEAVSVRVNGDTPGGYIKAIAGAFNDDDNRHLTYNSEQLRDLGILANLRQIGRELSGIEAVEEITKAVGNATNELGGLLASKTTRSPPGR